MPIELLFLLPLAFAAGLINAVVGGGGLILVPGLFAALPKEMPASLLASDKFCSVMGHCVAMSQYARRMVLPWRMLVPAALVAFTGAIAGASVVSYLPSYWVRPLVIVLVVVMLLYTWFRPQFGATDANRPITARDMRIGLLLGAVIGFYDGFFGPATGSFLIFLFVRVFHYDFMRASACAKVVNFATNLGALCFFLPKGLVLFEIAIPLGIANIAGALVGTRLAFRGGNQWIRKLFLVLALGLLAKLVYDLLR